MVASGNGERACYPQRLWLAPWPSWMLLSLRPTSERPGDDVDWTGITDLVEVVGACTLPGFSGVVLEKAVKGQRAAWDCGADRETRKPDTQCRRHSLVAITGFPEFILNKI